MWLSISERCTHMQDITRLCSLKDTHRRLHTKEEQLSSTLLAKKKTISRGETCRSFCPNSHGSTWMTADPTMLSFEASLELRRSTGWRKTLRLRPGSQVHHFKCGKQKSRGLESRDPKLENLANAWWNEGVFVVFFLVCRVRNTIKDNPICWLTLVESVWKRMKAWDPLCQGWEMPKTQKNNGICKAWTVAQLMFECESRDGHTCVCWMNLS